MITYEFIHMILNFNIYKFGFLSLKKFELKQTFILKKYYINLL